MDSIIKYHSQPHAISLNKFSLQTKNNCSVDYFTSDYFYHEKQVKSLKYRFFPVSFSLRGDHKKFRKQSSKNCLKEYEHNTPDITIINMSGHSSEFAFILSKIILENKKRYIAMLGGQHYTENKRNNQYFNNADHLLVHTKSQKIEMMKIKMFKNQDIRVFPLGVDIDKFKSTEKFKKNIEKPKLIYVGRIVNWKRIHLAIEAVNWLVNNQFPETILKIVGPISSKKYFIKLKKMIKNYNLEKNILFIGEKKHSDLISLYRESDLFLLPSELETFGMVMIESMACGTPVAAINSMGGPKDTITNYENGIICNIEEYNQNIKYFFTDNSLRKRIIKNAIKTVHSNFSIQKTTEVLYKSLNYDM